jgi:hypothetical protein
MFRPVLLNLKPKRPRHIHARGPLGNARCIVSQTLPNERHGHKADRHSPTRNTRQTGRSVELRPGLVGPLVVIAQRVGTMTGREGRVPHGRGRSLSLL